MAMVSMATIIGKDDIKLRIPVSPLRKPYMVANYFNILTQFVVTAYGLYACGFNQTCTR